MQPFSSFFAVFALALGLLAGCHTYVQPDPPPPFAGTTVSLAGPEGVVGLALDASAGWRDDQQARTTRAATEDEADVWIIRPARLPSLVSQGKLRRVPKELDDPDGAYGWRGLVRAYSEQLVLWGKQPYALPIAAEAPVCFYRKGAFTDARKKDYQQWQAKKGLSPNYPLDAPATWQQYERLARYLHDTDKRPSLPPLPARDDRAGLSRLFYTAAASFARRAVRADEPDPKDEAARRLRDQELFFFHYDERSAEPRINSRGFLEALKLLQRLQPYRGRAASPEEALLNGEASLGIAEAGLLMRLQNNPKTRDQYAVCPVPGSEVSWGASGEVRAGVEGNRVPYLGGAGWLAVVPKTAKHPEAAWSLLADLSGADTASEIAHDPRWGGGSVRRKPLRRSHWGSFGVEGEAAQRLREALDSSLIAVGNPAYILRVPDREQRETELAEAVSRALREGKDAKACLDEAAAAWKMMDRKIGKAEALNRYKESVGLARD